MKPLEVLDAIEFKRRLAYGHSRPGVFLCQDGAGSALDCVTKFTSESFRGAHSRLYEAVASKLAEHFEIRTPPPVVVRLDESLADALAFDPEVATTIRRNTGLNFGTEYRAGYTTWPQDRPIPFALRTAASDIFAFDALIDNGNRTADNPNLLANSSELLVLDHELAFQFLSQSGGTASDVERAVQGLSDHPFYRSFRRNRLDLDHFAAKLFQLDAARTRELKECLPHELWGPELNQILAWLNLLHSRRAEFLRAVQEVL